MNYQLYSIISHGFILSCITNYIVLSHTALFCHGQVLLKRAVVEHAIGVRRKSLLLRFPKDKMKKRRRHGEEELDYLEKRTKSVHRRKTNPEVCAIVLAGAVESTQRYVRLSWLVP